MAIAVITIKDVPNGVNISLESDPPTEEQDSVAQVLAMLALKFAEKALKEAINQD